MSARRAKGDRWAPLHRVPPHEITAAMGRQIAECGSTTYDGMLSVWRNHLYVVQVFDAGEGVRHLAIRSVPDGVRPSWPHCQRMKDEIAGPDAVAIELFPAAAAVVDNANVFHLWVLPPEHVLPLRLGRVDAARRP